MLQLPMDMPVEIRRIGAVDGPTPQDATVARGPLVIMAYGLMSIHASERAGFHIASPMGYFSSAQVEHALTEWTKGRRYAPPGTGEAWKSSAM